MQNEGSEIKYAREEGLLARPSFSCFLSIHADYIIDSRAHACDSTLSLVAARRRALGSRLGAPAVKNCDYIL